MSDFVFWSLISLPFLIAIAATLIATIGRLRFEPVGWKRFAYPLYVLLIAAALYLSAAAVWFIVVVLTGGISE